MARTKLDPAFIAVLGRIRFNNCTVSQRGLAENITTYLRGGQANSTGTGHILPQHLTQLDPFRVGGGSYTGIPSQATIYNRIRAIDGNLDLATGATVPSHRTMARRQSQTLPV